AQPPTQPPTQTPTQPPTQPTVQAAVQRPGATLLNPAISVILDTYAGGIGGNGNIPVAGDDPALNQDGFGVEEVELGFQAAIDPYLEGAVFLTIPNLDGIEVEEAYLITTSLPWNLQLKAGSFRSVVSRNNSQHLHLQNFTRRPMMTQNMFGFDGLRGPG